MALLFFDHVAPESACHVLWQRHSELEGQGPVLDRLRRWPNAGLPENESTVLRETEPATRREGSQLLARLPIAPGVKMEPYTEEELLTNPEEIINRQPQVVSEFTVNPIISLPRVGIEIEPEVITENQDQYTLTFNLNKVSPPSV